LRAWARSRNPERILRRISPPSRCRVMRRTFKEREDETSQLNRLDFALSS